MGARDFAGVAVSHSAVEAMSVELSVMPRAASWFNILDRKGILGLTAPSVSKESDHATFIQDISRAGGVSNIVLLPHADRFERPDSKGVDVSSLKNQLGESYINHYANQGTYHLDVLHRIGLDGLSAKFMRETSYLYKSKGRLLAVINNFAVKILSDNGLAFKSVVIPGSIVLSWNLSGADLVLEKAVCSNSVLKKIILDQANRFAVDESDALFLDTYREQEWVGFQLAAIKEEVPNVVARCLDQDKVVSDLGHRELRSYLLFLGGGSYFKAGDAPAYFDFEGDFQSDVYIASEDRLDSSSLLIKKLLSLFAAPPSDKTLLRIELKRILNQARSCEELLSCEEDYLALRAIATLFSMRLLSKTYIDRLFPKKHLDFIQMAKSARTGKTAYIASTFLAIFAIVAVGVMVTLGHPVHAIVAIAVIMAAASSYFAAVGAAASSFFSRGKSADPYDDKGIEMQDLGVGSRSFGSIAKTLTDGPSLADELSLFGDSFIDNSISSTGGDAAEAAAGS
ncbi:MAG: hypothetical protein JXR42_00530 [Gammaproteobacteria bacterium]|nr:hypothetical protein [Gammaproteobacteria bacterium]